MDVVSELRKTTELIWGNMRMRVADLTIHVCGEYCNVQDKESLSYLNRSKGGLLLVIYETKIPSLDYGCYEDGG